MDVISGVKTRRNSGHKCCDDMLSEHMQEDKYAIEMHECISIVEKSRESC